ncbi:hypothetical protein [Marinilabilia salmonicolor]|uniref:hypothetical protein n=1 Tax=Marinilabilia salmonicolor TaxID=989 RepID=UPI0011C03DDA|nr:hypothetical protein [Marinilabilia salmonicolor]
MSRCWVDVVLFVIAVSSLTLTLSIRIFLDQHHIYKKEINEKQHQAFYDIIENLQLCDEPFTNQETWRYHLTYPSKNELISYTGGICNGKGLLKEAIEELGLTAEFSKQED